MLFYRYDMSECMGRIGRTDEVLPIFFFPFFFPICLIWKVFLFEILKKIYVVLMMPSFTLMSRLEHLTMKTKDLGLIPKAYIASIFRDICEITIYDNRHKIGIFQGITKEWVIVSYGFFWRVKYKFLKIYFIFSWTTSACNFLQRERERACIFRDICDITIYDNRHKIDIFQGITKEWVIVSYGFFWWVKYKFLKIYFIFSWT
jgi:hypothetical protein